MCRNIKMLFNFDPPVTPEEVHAASLQYVRKISGFNKPSKANEAAFLAAIDEVAAAHPGFSVRSKPMRPPGTGKKKPQRRRLAAPRDIPLKLPTAMDGAHVREEGLVLCSNFPAADALHPGGIC